MVVIKQRSANGEAIKQRSPNGAAQRSLSKMLTLDPAHAPLRLRMSGRFAPLGKRDTYGRHQTAKRTRRSHQTAQRKRRSVA